MKQRLITESIIEAGVRTSRIGKSLKTDCRTQTQICILKAAGIPAKCLIAYGGVGAGNGIGNKRRGTDGRVRSHIDALSDKKPTAVLNVPVVRLRSAELPSAVLPPA
jgi:hypothetical protein